MSTNLTNTPPLDRMAFEWCKHSDHFGGTPVRFSRFTMKDRHVYVFKHKDCWTALVFNRLLEPAETDQLCDQLSVD
ncbi:MAG: hypothetical protein D3926_17845 [Desulfobacteraceae bacterium]|nr:MAG: hypothetical protein D3926_17845 [Desulfobacteraceae bacterium]